MVGTAPLISLLIVLGQERGTIKGRVLDEGTEKPVSGVNVIVRGGKMGTMTDTAGYFRLELPTREQRLLVFSHIAYQKQTRMVSFGTTTEAEFRIRRVLVWDYLGVNKDIDLFPIGLPIHQGMYVILVETK